MSAVGGNQFFRSPVRVGTILPALSPVLMRMFAMKRFGLVCLLAALAAVVSLSSPAQAQIYAAPAGSGTTCSAVTPCALATAFSSVTTSGQVISCIEGGNGVSGFGASISVSFTVDCPGAVIGPTDSNGITLTGTSSQVVILRNLTFQLGLDQHPLPFVKVTGGATVIIENCKFENIAGSPAIAVQFIPNKPAAQLIIRDSVFANNGAAPSSGGGLQVAPAAGGSASVVLERVSFNLNVTSMVLSGPVNATMINSTVSASRSNGILVGSGSTLVVKDSTLAYNVGAAVSVASGGTLRLSNDDIESNQVGISNSGGQALTYSNNRIFGNGSTATLTSVQGGQ
jgi:hypothetical protein